MNSEELPFAPRETSNSLQQQLSSYHERQRNKQRRHHHSILFGRIIVGFVAASLLTLLLVALWWPAPRNMRAIKVQTLLDIYEKERNFSGVVQLSYNGETKWQQAMGSANVPFQQPMKVQSVFPMGAHVQLLVAVAMYQLQEKGVVQLSNPIDDYWTKKDWQAFGTNQTSWCPQVQKRTNHCERVTFQHLLYMGSGLESKHLDRMATLGRQVGSFINTPLKFIPGTNYHDAKENYILLMYMIERLSELTFAHYVTLHIFQLLGLQSAGYDPFDGIVQVHTGLVDQYIQYYQYENASISGNNTSVSPSKLILEKHLHYVSTGSCALYQALENPFDGFVSTSTDMHFIYWDLFHAQGQYSKLLKPWSIADLLGIRNPAFRAFAQGVGVTFENENEKAETTMNWPTRIAFCGTSGCATTCMAMQMPSANISIVASAFTNDMRLHFPSADALHAFTPRQLINKQNAMLREDLYEENNGDVNTLAWKLLETFL
ncbi:hypothetical protein CCR75_004419 [Bremia lactucae]|uniref:Beta-lactamase-related domain-containing protein n=1 Tax=Bremia lactucae TaxID=4779 RepID=A0A976FR84_BRELC|nr:hypothetical protein CCR75_004419 [Bremia lactucae]